MGRTCAALGFAGLLACAALGQTTPPTTPESAALDHFYNLEYAAAIAGFQTITAAQPTSVPAWNHLAQAELYQEMYRIGALESQLYGHGDPFLETKTAQPDPAANAAFLASIQHALDLGKWAVAQHPNDAHAHYDLAVAYALHGNWEFSVHKGYWDALSDAKSARAEAERALALDPQLEDARLIVGVQSYVAGSLPWAVRMFSKLVGYSGDKEKGRAMIAGVAARGEHARTDAAVLLAVIDRRDGLNAQAAPLFASVSAQYPRNVLFAMETGEAEEAAAEHDTARAQFASIISRAQQGTPGYRAAPLCQAWYDIGEIDELYSRWSEAVEDFENARQQPHAPPALVAAATQAEQAARHNQPVH